MTYKLLIAEGDPEARSELKALLTAHADSSLVIFEADSGPRALELFYQQSPAIAILNIELQGLSGLEVARCIRQSRSLCALLFTADTDRLPYARQAISLRALDYMPKPYDPHKLRLSLQEALQSLDLLAASAAEIPPRPESRPAVHNEDARLAMVRKDISLYIDSHYMEELSMKTVAHAMNYSDAYFCKLFKQCFRVNFSAYLNEYRVCKAKAMIANPRISIKDVGQSCGYSDPNYFARVFKRITGQTPTEYRMTMLEDIRKDLETR